MNLSVVDKALLLAAYFRGNPPEQTWWSSSSDQVITLSLFYTSDLTADECATRFETGYISHLYRDDGELQPQIETRYRQLIDLIEREPLLIRGGGNLRTPAHPTYTACRLTDEGDRLIPELIQMFPRKPGFPNWPDKRVYPDSVH